MTVRQQIETRITDKCTQFREVGGAANLQDILKGRVSAPGCYVYRASVRPRRNEHDDRVVQYVAETYALVVVSRNVSSDRGDSSDDNELLCDALSVQLLGWQPDSQMTPFEYAGGRLVSLQGGFFYWQELYTTGRLRQSAI